MTKALALSLGLMTFVVGCGSSAVVVRGPDQTSAGVHEERLRSAPAGYLVMPVQSRQGALQVPLARATCNLQK